MPNTRNAVDGSVLNWKAFLLISFINMSTGKKNYRELEMIANKKLQLIDNKKFKGKGKVNIYVTSTTKFPNYFTTIIKLYLFTLIGIWILTIKTFP